MKNTLFIILFTLSCGCVIAQTDRTEENKIVAQVQQLLPQSLKELEQVVNINSGTMNFTGVKQVGNIFKQQFDKLGFKTQWIDGKPFNRAGHLLASHGDKGLKILMIGHLDTVFSKQDSFQKFKKINDKMIAGPGITDMKGGNVIIVSAIKALKKANLLNNVSIKVILTGDEERSGRPLSLSKKAIVEAAKWADIALGFEDGDGDIKTAVIARRGAVGWTLKVEGKPAHSSQIFRDDIGYGAIFETARILNTFRQKLEKEELLTFNPGMIVGGTTTSYDKKSASGEAFGKSNVIAQTTQVTGDIRALSAQQLEKAKRAMQQIAQQNLPHTSATLTFKDGYPPMAPTNNNKQLLSIYSQISEDLGYGKVEAVNPRRAGAADISFAANHVEMALDGLGLMGTGGHTKDEIADISSLSKNIEKAAILIYRLAQQSAKN
ncbi:M20/M25/M40 family metallo-hydrolase [Aliikangiella sp. IMCC44359]|uniref:M20/M25/M40 family metallo-hydrolase n=1 Tax=Aliikangiella sp. IMCC44359 TaxID=3459125 RepID=UPI00403B1CBF